MKRKDLNGCVGKTVEFNDSMFSVMKITKSESNEGIICHKILKDGTVDTSKEYSFTEHTKNGKLAAEGAENLLSKCKLLG